MLILRYSLWATAAGLGVAAAVVEAVNGQPAMWGMPGITGVWAVSFATAGSLIAGRQPGNPIGWLLLGSGIFAGLNGALGFAPSFGASSLAVAAWEFTWIPSIAGLITALALFPDGRLPSRRWALTVWALWTAVLVMAVVLFSGRAGVARLPAEVFLQLSFLPPLVALAVRFRRSRGTERQQLKWIAYAAGLVLATAATAELLFRFYLPDWYYAATVVLSLAILTVPVGIGVAILRYRLYDIDRIISRTVAYGLVTAVLVAGYAGAVVVFRAVLPGQTDLAVVASTLGVAALFNPVRGRVQAAVDRRFNRARYDAERIVDAFGQRLRSRAGVEDLGGELLGVAATTMQPVSASLWLRGGTS